MTEEDYDYDNDTAKKPSFDARLTYYKILGGYMKMIQDGILLDSLNLRLRGLKGLYFMTKPYMKKIESDDLKRDIGRASNAVKRALSVGGHNDVRAWKMSADDLLDVISEKIHDYAKHMMLPMSDTEDDTFDMDKFLKESDLG